MRTALMARRVRWVPLVPTAPMVRRVPLVRRARLAPPVRLVLRVRPDLLVRRGLPVLLAEIPTDCEGRRSGVALFL